MHTLHIEFSFPSESAYKTCGPEGRWVGKMAGDFSLPQGWTNYTDCYTAETRRIYHKIFGQTSSKVGWTLWYFVFIQVVLLFVL